MDFAPTSFKKPIVLHLQKDLVRSVKRGHPWIYNYALAERPDALYGDAGSTSNYQSQGLRLAKHFIQD